MVSRVPLPKTRDTIPRYKSSDQFERLRFGNGLHAALDVEFGVDVGQVRLHCAGRDAQRGGDLAAHVLLQASWSAVLPLFPSSLGGCFYTICGGSAPLICCASARLATFLSDF